MWKVTAGSCLFSGYMGSDTFPLTAEQRRKFPVCPLGLWDEAILESFQKTLPKGSFLPRLTSGKRRWNVLSKVETEEGGFIIGQPIKESQLKGCDEGFSEEYISAP